MINAIKSINLAVPEILFGLGVIGELGNRARSLGATKVIDRHGRRGGRGGHPRTGDRNP